MQYKEELVGCRDQAGTVVMKSSQQGNRRVAAEKEGATCGVHEAKVSGKRRNGRLRSLASLNKQCLLRALKRAYQACEEG